jgi:hypothetical protein
VDLKGLPIGQAKFESIRRKNFIYADKTELLYPLVNSELPYFLSLHPAGSANLSW